MVAVSKLGTKLELEIVTPSGVEYTSRVTGIVVPAEDGYLGVRPGHAELLTSLQPGVVTIHENDEDRYAAVSGGIMEVFHSRVAILADTAELASEIDIARAQDALRRARRRLEMPWDERMERDIDTDRAQAALLRATTRLRTAEKADRR